MALSHFLWLCIILPTVIIASPQEAIRPRSTSSPSLTKLQGSVPACAQPCLQRSITEQYPLSCTLPIDLTCLCSRYASDGETLGEIALRCLYTSCSTSDPGATSAYNVCLGQQGAVSPTLTAFTVAATSKISSSTSIASSIATQSTRSTVASSSTNTAIPSSRTNSFAANSVQMAPLPTSPSAPQTSESAVAAAAATMGPKTMSPAQIAGLTVAAVGAFAVAIGVMALSIFVRRRRERRQVAAISEKGSAGYSPNGRSSLDLPRHYIPSHILPKSRSDQSGGPQRYSQGQPRKQDEPGSRRTAFSWEQPHVEKFEEANHVHPLLRDGLSSSKDASKFNMPPEPIGMAISAELPARSMSKQHKIATMLVDQSRRDKTRSIEALDRKSSAAQRPYSTVSQGTVFEEDDVRAMRRESKLLPMPSLPVPPIRSFQPSREASKSGRTQDIQNAARGRKPSKQPELFLDIPERHSRTLVPAMRTQLQDAARNRPAMNDGVKQQHLVPPIQKTSGQSGTSTASSSVVDIPDYYFFAHKDPPPKYSTSAAAASQSEHRNLLAAAAEIRPKLSSSNVSQITSVESIDRRQSTASQTSFESNGDYDSTPEDEDDDKQLTAENRLSPVVESPISSVRYPKVPRSSCQLVPRSPRSPMSQKSLESPVRAPEPSTWLHKRSIDQPILQLTIPPTMGSPPPVEVRQQIREYRMHLRSSSLETWSTSEPRSATHSTRVQSSAWTTKKPNMHDPDLDTIRPLNVRSKTFSHLAPPPTREEMQALNSPIWIPRLTPTRQGEDLFINVTYSKPSA